MSTGKIPTFRFAPSPNGLLHLGHAYSAILNVAEAKSLNGVFRLRIEDIDNQRSNEDYIAAITRDLHWLGFTWPEPVRRQSEHLGDYKAAIDELKRLDLLYPCFASRGDIKAHNKSVDKDNVAKEGVKPKQAGQPKTDPDGSQLYPGIYKHLSCNQANERIAKGEPYALRLHMDEAIRRARKILNAPLCYKTFSLTTKADAETGTNTDAATGGDSEPNQQSALQTEIPLEAERWGDVIIARKDIPTSYHLSVVVDDHLEGITHICRGKDLEAATDIHRILQINLGLHSPLYHHHDLVKIEKQKLSKSKSHISLFQMREAGITAEEITSAAKIGPIALSAYLP